MATQTKSREMNPWLFSMTIVGVLTFGAGLFGAAGPWLYLGAGLLGSAILVGGIQWAIRDAVDRLTQ